MKSRLYITLAGLFVALMTLSAKAMAFTNTPLPVESGVTTEVCDIRNASDYGASDPAVDKSLRDRIDLFNAEASGGPQKCLFLIYFLDPYSITLKQPLKIKALQHPYADGAMLGTEISGGDSSGKSMGVTIDGYDVTNNANSNCAIMIDGGLASIQQIHNLTIIATSANRAICDQNGNDLMNQPIPETTVRQTCSAGQLAKDCDFKGVNVFVKPGSSTAPKPVCNLVKTASAGGGYDLTWTTTNATTASLSDGSSTPLSTALNAPPAPSVHVNPTVTTTYTLSASGDGGGCESVQVIDVGSSTDSPTCSFSFAQSGNGYDLTWTTHNATTATVSDGTHNLSTDLNSASPLHVTPVMTTTYTLTANGTGSPCVRSIELQPVTTAPGSSPTCDLHAVTNATAGFDLTWTSASGASATLTDGHTILSTSLNSSGPLNVAPASPTTYTFTVMGAGGSCAKSITLTPGSAVPTSPTCGISSATDSGGGYDLTWTTTNASSASVSDGTSTLSTDLNKAAPGLKVTPTSPKIYTLSADSTGAHCAAAIVLPPGAVPPAPTCSLTSASDATSGIDLTWTSTNGMTATLSDGSNVLSTDFNSSSALNVTPTAATTYTFTVTGLGGSCSRAISVGAGGGSVVVPTCDLTVANGTTSGFDLAWTSANATSVSLSDGTNTLSTDPTSTTPVHVDPSVATFYILTATNTDGLCSRGILLSPASSPSVNGLPDSDKDGIPDAVETVNGTDPNNPDTDGDGVCDGPNTVKDGSGNVICEPFNGHQDNCPLVSNGPNTPGLKPEDFQKDTNGDGVGDVCQVLFDIQGGGGSGCSLIMAPGDMSSGLSTLLTMGFPLVSLAVMRKKKK